MADIIVVGGGNTLYAMDRWQRLNVVPILQAAIERGVIVTGGSAGAICWFDGGHSDSMDPDTYYGPMMQKFGSTVVGKADLTMDESTIASSSGSDGPKGVATKSGSTNNNNNSKEEEMATKNKKKKDWKYIRVTGLGFLPGLVCPHHDRIQSNGVLRAHDFDEMLLHKHPGEVGIGIDHWAALVVDRAQDSYRVVSLEGKPGSVVYHHNSSTTDDHDDFDDDKDSKAATITGSSIGSFSADGTGVPGVWLKQVKQGKVVAKVLPAFGKLSDILRPAESIVEDHDALARCRRENPDILLDG